MTIQISRRDLIIGSLGAAALGLATLVFDLHVHVGSLTMTGTPRYFIAALGGALCAVIVDRALRDYWKF